MKTLLSWSSGKDSAWALHLLKQNPEIDLVGLFTTVNEAFDRVAMHGVREDVLEAQAAAAGLPLTKIAIPWPCSNEDYERIMGAFIEDTQGADIEAIAFGDLFLEDIRDYRIANLEGTGIKPLFPVWGLDTAGLAREMITSGLKTHIICVDPKQLNESFCGRVFDDEFIDELPEDVDPCGENGEFHTCVVAGPMFDNPISVVSGDVVQRDGFIYADLKLDKDS